MGDGEDEMFNPAYFVADKRVFALLIAFIIGLYFIIVNNATLRSTATIYLFGALIVLASLPMLRLLAR